MDRLDLDALMLGREANVRYASGARRLWTASSRPFGPTCVARTRDRPRASHDVLRELRGRPRRGAVRRRVLQQLQPGQAARGAARHPRARSPPIASVSTGFRCSCATSCPTPCRTRTFIGVGSRTATAAPRKLPAELDAMRIAISIAESALYAAARERPRRRTGEVAASGLPRPDVHARHLAVRAAGHVHGDRRRRRDPLDHRRGCRLRDGDLVVLAGGALWAGYEGSLARTWCSGAPRHRRTATSTSGGNGSSTRSSPRHARAQPAPISRPRTKRRVKPLPPMPIAYSVGLGHEGPLAGTAARRRRSSATNASTPAMCHRVAHAPPRQRRRLFRRRDGLRRRGQDRVAHHARALLAW